MGRHGLSVLTVFLVVGQARAANAQPLDDGPCPPPEEAVFPADGARDVPRNTQIWIGGSESGSYVLKGRGFEQSLTYELVGRRPFLRLRPPRLDAGATYTLRHDGELISTFQTSAIDDVAPPATPVGLGLLASISQQRLVLEATPSADTTVLEIALVESPPGPDEVLPPTIESRLGFRGAPSCFGIDLPRNAELCATVRAVDLAGNRSEPARTCTHVQTEGPYGLPSVDRGAEEQQREHEHQRAARVGAVLGLWSIAIVLAIALWSIHAWRVRRRFTEGHELISREPVVRVARSRRRLALWLIVVAASGVGGAVFARVDRDVLAWAVGGAGWLAVLAGTFAARAHRVIVVLTGFGGEARAAGDGYVYATRAGRCESWIGVTPPALVRAAGRGLPGARVRRD